MSETVDGAGRKKGQKRGILGGSNFNNQVCQGGGGRFVWERNWTMKKECHERLRFRLWGEVRKLMFTGGDQRPKVYRRRKEAKGITQTNTHPRGFRGGCSESQRARLKE